MASVPVLVALNYSENIRLNEHSARFFCLDQIEKELITRCF